MHLAVLGLGQIGGSIARAATGFAGRVTAWTPSGDGPRSAAADGIVAAETAGEAVRGADLIVLAAPPLACLGLLDELAGPLAADLSRDAVITDVASTKVAIVERARGHRLRFVGGHPMAGREAAGYASADPGLFGGRPWVVVPPQPPDAAAEARVVALATAVGAHPIRMDALDHDEAAAAISHAPLVLAAALVETVTAAGDWHRARELVAGGWASMTRLALGDPAMGAGILATNGPATAARLQAIRDDLDVWIALLGGSRPPDDAVIQARLAAARERARG